MKMKHSLWFPSVFSALKYNIYPTTTNRQGINYKQFPVNYNHKCIPLLGCAKLKICLKSQKIVVTSHYNTGTSFNF